MARPEPSLEELVFTALGTASVCWVPAPEGVFDSARAEEVGNKLIEALKARGAK